MLYCLFVLINKDCGIIILNSWLNIGPITIPAIILAKSSNFSLQPSVIVYSVFSKKAQSVLIPEI